MNKVAHSIHPQSRTDAESRYPVEPIFRLSCRRHPGILHGRREPCPLCAALARGNTAQGEPEVITRAFGARCCGNPDCGREPAPGQLFCLSCSCETPACRAGRAPGYRLCAGCLRDEDAAGYPPRLFRVPEPRAKRWGRVRRRLHVAARAWTVGTFAACLLSLDPEFPLPILMVEAGALGVGCLLLLATTERGR